MAVGAIIAVVAAAGAAIYKSDKNRKGAHQAQDQQNKANSLYQTNYEQTQSEFAPYQEGGQSAYQQLLKSYGLGEGQNGQADYSGFQNSPDYQFNLQQGTNALDRSAASKGRLFSGQQMKGSQEFGQGLASTQLNTYRQGLQGIANQGMNANNVLSNYRLGFGNQLGQGYTNIGDIQLARQLGQGQIGAQFINSLGSAAGSYYGGGQQMGQSSFGGGGGSSDWSSSNGVANGWNPKWGSANNG